MSSTAATAGWIRRPVIIVTSSMVSTLVGSAMATTSSPLDRKPTGTAW